jgi:hypothetical protein
MRGSRLRTAAALGAVALALWGCETSPLGPEAWVGQLLHADGPRGAAVLRFDGVPGGVASAGRRIQTIPADAAKVRVTIYDPLGFTVGGLPLSDIPEDRSFTLKALPAGVVLKFDMRMADTAGNEVAKAVRKETLVANATKEVEATVYMDAPQLLTDTVTVSSGEESSQDVIAVQFRLANGSHYRFTPTIKATHSANVDVTSACSPTYQVTAGDRHSDNTPGEEVTATDSILTAGTGQRFDVKARVTPSCPAEATSITRYLKAEQVATVSAVVN